MAFKRILALTLVLFSTTLFASIGKVSLVKGEATALRNAQTITLKNNDPVEEKDTIKTGKNAQIQLIFEDKTVITLGGESDFKIEEYLAESASPKAKFKFNQGAFKTITGAIGKQAPQNFTMETKTATIGIRGTIVAGNVPPPPLPNVPPLPESIFCLGGTITVAPIALPAIAVVIPTGSFTQMSAPTTPPTPPAPFTPADLQQLNQNLGGTPPPPPPANDQNNDNPPPSGNTPPTANPDGGNDAPPPPPPPPPAPTPAASNPSGPMVQGFTPTAALAAQQTNLQTNLQDQVIADVAKDLGVDPDDFQQGLQNQVCPAGTTGVYPDCRAPTCADLGQQGTYPDCGTCPAGTTGIYPACVALTCPTGTTGTYPDCGTCPAGTTGIYPACVALTCPTGTTGTYPDCGTCPAGTTGIYPACVALTCPTGTTGTYPDCGTCPAGTTGIYPACVALTCPTGTTGTYPDCGTCPAGTTGIYPACVALTCPTGTTGTYPDCGTCPAGTTGIYPACVALTCPTGTTGTYPDCGTCPAGTTGIYPACVALTCPTGTTGTYPDCGTCPAGTTGIYPACVALTCPTGTTGTYPDCGTCPAGTTGIYPACVALTCPTGTTGTYPDCVAHTCPAGTTGTYPDCTTIPSGGGGGTTPTTVTKELTVLGARESINGTYMYLEPTTITLTGSSLSSLAGSFSVPLFSDINASQVGTDTISISGVSEDLTAQWSNSTGQLLLFGTPLSLLPTDGITRFTELDYTGAAQMEVNFANKRALMIDFDDTDNGLFLFFGTLSNSATFDGSIYSYGTGFSDHAEGNVTGVLFGTSSLPSRIGFIGVDYNGSHYSAGAYGGDASDYKPTANATGTLTLTGLTTTRYIDGSEMVQTDCDEINITIARETGSTTGVLTLYNSTQDRAPYSLIQTDANKSSYIHDNYFAITGFDAQESWLVAFPSDVNFTTADSTLSWGMWAVNETNSSKLLPYYNYWVAGSTLTSTAMLADLEGSTYTYNGKVLGAISNNGAVTPITPSNSSVRFVFNFGSQMEPININESYIRFGSWDLTPSSGSGISPDENYFSGGLAGVDSNGSSFYGYFYGSYAESIGGAFQASDSVLGDARGVFVGAKISEAQPDTSFTLSGKAHSWYQSTPAMVSLTTDDIEISSETSSDVLATVSLTYRDENVSLGSPTNATVTSFDQFHTDTIYTDNNATPNPYVAYGYWVGESIDNNATLLPGTYVWYAGRESLYALSYLNSTLRDDVAPKTYTYNGNIIGKVTVLGTDYPIDPTTNNAIALKMNFGGGFNSLLDTSTMVFQTLDTSHRFDILLKGQIFYSGFWAMLKSGTYNESNPLEFLSLEGQFFGDQAQAAGGLFNTGSNVHYVYVTGAFKALYDGNAILQATPSYRFKLDGLATYNYFTTTPVTETATLQMDTYSDFSASTHVVFPHNSAERWFSSSNSTIVDMYDFNLSQNYDVTNFITDTSIHNDYVSWGYWTSPEVDGNTTLMAGTDNFWVAGKDAEAAATYITGLIGDVNTPVTSYLYNGKVLGRVLDSLNVSHAIDTANNSVNLYFDFGGGVGSLKDTSRITFTANSTPWELQPTATVTGGTFTGPIGGSGITGTIKGKFFGNEAQAVGGTFNATDGTNKALGVFKATGGIYLP